MIATRLKLSNIIAIVDANNLQGYDSVENIQQVSTFKKKWDAFGWNVQEVDGHDVKQLKNALKLESLQTDYPTVLIAHTIKGRGISEMEGVLGWHYYSVTKEKLPVFLKELEENA